MAFDNFLKIKNKYGSIYISYQIISSYVCVALKNFKDYSYQSHCFLPLKDDYYSLELTLKPLTKKNHPQAIKDIAKNITFLYKKVLNLKVIAIINI